jgi:hypothetical protein
LNEDVKELSDVVVVGYGTQNKAKVTGATATLKMNDVLGDRPGNKPWSFVAGSYSRVTGHD